MTALPSIPTPVAGEALDAYLERCSTLHQVPFSVILNHCGLPDRDATLSFAPWLPDQYLAQIADGLDLAAGDVRAMTLAGAFPHILPALRQARTPIDVTRAAARDWFHISGSRYCPQCLAETGTWQLVWRLPQVVMCSTHHVLLADTCPDCGAWPRSGTRPTASPRTGWETPRRQATCYAAQPPHDRVQGRGATPCEGDLTRHPRTRAPTTNAAIDSHIRAAVQGTATRVAGLTLDPYQSLTALRGLIVVSSHLSGQTTDGRRTWRTPPRSATTVSAHLDAVHDIVTAPTVNAAGRALHALADLHHVHLDHNYFRDRLGASPALQPVLDEALQASGRPSTRLRRTAQQHLDLFDYTPDQVPQLAWPCLIPPDLEHTTGRPSRTMIRAFLSLAVVRLVTGGWEHAQDALGFAEGTGRQWSRYVTNRLPHPEREALLAAVMHGAGALGEQRPSRDWSTTRATVTSARDLRRAQAGDCTEQGADWCPCNSPSSTQARAVGR